MTQITYKDKWKIGSFHLEYDKWSDRLAYRYYTEKGNKGTGTISMEWVKRCLEEDHLLFTDPEMGKKENYI